ncbi:MAG: chemotaxis protein CheW [Bacteroidales bacterium]|jgi:purine-binding chemotaxis protein CheW|nr:chemotaxis protein CheW [Bacteroidales bacterium]MDD4057615.1 chemotaxis protein CheW [Bacteroidales bacterium]
MNKDSEILHKRALNNALRLKTDENEVKVDYLVFRVVKELYALEKKWVKEVVKINSFTKIPGTPEFVTGVSNVRGIIYSAININRFLSSKEFGLSDLNKMIIISNGEIEYGILADEIIGFSENLVDVKSEIPDNYSNIYKEFIIGITTNSILILNGKALTENKKIIIE